MKKGIKLGSLLVIITLTIAPASSDAFNPLAHIFIAENACSSCSSKIDCYYGSIVPDVAWSVANPDNWDTRAFDTHYRDLSSFASGSIQEAFAIGWLTHSENPASEGADYFAHIAYSGNPAAGYVIDKAYLLLDDLEWDITTQNLAFAHYIIEATIDFLLKDVDPTLPGKLFFANLFRSWQDRNLMMRAFVWNWSDRKTDWLTLAIAELTFRQLINRYATVLMLPEPHDEAALAQLGADLAMEMFGLVIDPNDLRTEILPAAIFRCEEDPDYLDVINEAITAVSAHLP